MDGRRRCAACSGTESGLQANSSALSLWVQASTTGAGQPPFSRLLGNERRDDGGRFMKRSIADIPNRLVEGRDRKPLNQFRENDARRLPHSNDQCHGAAGHLTRNEGACDRPAGRSGEVNRVRQYDNVQVMVAVAARRDVTRSDHRPAALFA